MKTQTESIIQKQRNEAYEAFRNFSNDPNQKGDTLISTSPFKLTATKSFSAKRAYIIRRAFKPETKIAANSLLIPNEICWAAGFTPFNWEMFSSLLASHSRIIEITNRGSAPVPRCSFMNSLKGANIEKILPSPNVTFSSTAFCEGIGHMISELTGEIQVPHYHLDIPGFAESGSTDYLALQIEKVFHAFCDLNNISQTEREARLMEAFYYSVKAKHEYLKIQELREQHAPLNLGLEPLHWHMQFSPLWGTEDGYELSKRLRVDLEEYIDKNEHKKQSDALPISIFGLIPYGRSPIWKQLLDSKAFTTFEGVNYLGEVELPKEDEVEFMEDELIFKNLAKNMIEAPVRGLNFEEKAEIFISKVKQSGAKGLLIFSHEHCQMLAWRLEEYERRATEEGLSFVSISGDCILGMPQGPTGIRLGTFLSELTKTRDKNKQLPKAKSGKVNGKLSGHTIPEVRVGVDFGSGFSKYIAVSKTGDIIQEELFNSGIDYPKILEDIKSRLEGFSDIGFSIAGIGSDNTYLRSLVDSYTTEINALLKAVKAIYSHLDSFQVIDIGTQDVKVIKFYHPDRNPWINTSKSCGAGTGMVLVQILERWRQTQPELKYDDLDNMAFGAQRAELVNTTCGIFAVTNVVSALIQSDIERKKEILKGVYDYIAAQALKLMPNEVNNNVPLLLVGGLARHASLRKIFREKGYELLELPNNIPYQHLVSYGAALML